MTEPFHRRPRLHFRRLLATEGVEHLRNELIGFGENWNIHRGKRLMIHAPTIGPIAVDRAADDGFRRRLLGLRLAQAQAQHAGEIEPIQADNQIGFFNQRRRRLVGPHAGGGEVQRMGGGECRRIVAAGQHRGADRLGKAHAPIPIALIARHASRQDQWELRLLDGLQRLPNRRR